MNPTPLSSSSAQPSSAMAPRLILRSMDLDQMKAFVVAGAFPAYRGEQLYRWVFFRGAQSFEEMTNLPKAMIEWLRQRSEIGVLDMIDKQGEEGQTRKALFRLRDGAKIESVLMRDPERGSTGLCVSSQVGCAVGCTFCLTGFGGFQRQMTAEEIVGQVIEIRRGLLDEGELIQSLVFMGMGEPMLNLDNVIPAIRLMTEQKGMAISPRRITVSTAGILPGIEEFGRANTGVNLAVSLNATTDEVRSQIMPPNKKWPIADLLEACKNYPMSNRQRVTIEYVLIKGVNDSEADARRLVKMLRPLRCKVNLIMFNPHELLDYEPVSPETLAIFTSALSNARYVTSVRWSKGREIEAACGQLAGHYLNKN